MTDEEMAEEYAEGMAKYYESTHGLVPSQFEKYLKKAYLTGLKADKPKWHKVAKGDLPKEDLRARTLGYYLTASKCKSYKGVVFEVAYFTGVVFIKGGGILDNVVAWCEIPIFD